jgi:hypothetical protein
MIAVQFKHERLGRFRRWRGRWLSALPDDDLGRSRLDFSRLGIVTVIVIRIEVRPKSRITGKPMGVAQSADTGSHATATREGHSISTSRSGRKTAVPLRSRGRRKDRRSEHRKGRRN